MSNVLRNLRDISGVKLKQKTPALLMAQLMALGYSFDEVYPYIYDKPKAGYTDAEKVYIAEKEFREFPWVNRTIAALREKMNVISSEDANGKSKRKEGVSQASNGTLDYTKKEDIIAALSEEAKNLHGKERVDALIKLADLQRMKNEETKEEERHVLFYLPMANCENCPCFSIAKQQHPGLELVDNRPAMKK